MDIEDPVKAAEQVLEAENARVMTERLAAEIAVENIARAYELSHATAHRVLQQYEIILRNKAQARGKTVEDYAAGLSPETHRRYIAVSVGMVVMAEYMIRKYDLREDGQHG
jgi:isoaspartyl peptidase/L-asparaginase-like protein (Ntn-hydrolase superfamily)